MWDVVHSGHVLRIDDFVFAEDALPDQIGLPLALL